MDDHDSPKDKPGYNNNGVYKRGTINDHNTLEAGAAGHLHHPYFFTCILFLVEDRFYRLPRILFEGQSNIFKDMFLLPATCDNEEGTSVANPIRLDGVMKSDFESFLRVLIPLDPMRPDMTKQDWLNALKMATMWEFNSVRQAAINGLDQLPLTEVERVVILNEFDIKEWKIAAYSKLAIREKSLSVEDVDALGSWLTAKISAAREILLKDGNHKSGNEYVVQEAIFNVFGIEELISNNISQ